MILGGLFFAESAPAADGRPLSAIDWLSNSISEPETVEPMLANNRPGTALPPSISIAPLDAPVLDHAGLMTARSLGLSPKIWGRSSAADLARAVAALPDARLAPPSLRRFLHDLMVVRLDPPIDAGDNNALYLARLDRLLALGRLDSASRLIKAAGAPEPLGFRRAFDIALLTGNEMEACSTIEATPEISPTYPARIFCLARGGQWDVAALTLGNAEALGILSHEEDQLLLHFLDPDLFESEPLPPPPQLPSPLIFRLYEAVGERLSTAQLPVAFAHADLTDTVGWQTRLRAAERLAAVEAISFEQLLSVYVEREPAASGAVWERVRAVQALLHAVEVGEDEALAEALPEAWHAAGEGQFDAAMSRWIAPKLADRELDGPAGHVAFEISLLAGRTDLARRFAASTQQDQFLFAVAGGAGGVPPDGDPLGRAVLRGLSAINSGAQYEALIADGRSGEALLSALEVLMDGAAGNPDRAANALALLRQLGLETLARRCAVELLLKEAAA